MSDRATELAMAAGGGAGGPGKQYEVIGGAICQMRVDRDGTRSAHPLCNFVAEIVEEVTFDDGVEEARTFAVAGRVAGGEPLPPVTVPVSEYSAMSWLDKWGYGPLVYAGPSKRDHLRVAIHQMSRPSRRRVYAHTGWRQIGGSWVFLHAGGAVGAGDEISVGLQPPLDRFVLPERTVDSLDAVRWSLKILELAPMDLAAVLLGAIYLAPLSTFLPPDFTCWLLGPSGSFKSELSALAQRHFGATLDRTNLPATWGSTEAAIEQQAAILKDTLLVIDDFPPQADTHAQRDQLRRVERVLRHIGNRSGRGRMRADLTQRVPRPPRGLVMSSGEDLPPTRSIIARLVVVEVDKDRIDERVLTALQDNGGRLCHAMRAYIEYLQPRLHELQRTLPVRQRDVRALFHQAGRHARQAGALATLAIGFDLFMTFAADMGAISAEVADRFTADARDSLAALGSRQGQHLRDIDVADRFIEVLRQEVAQGRAILVDDDALELGPRPGVEMLGQRDADYAYVLPDLARRIVSGCLRAAGEAWDVSPLVLHKALVKKGFVIPASEGRIESQRRMGRSRPRVLKMPIGVLYDDDSTGPSARSGTTPTQAGGGASGAGRKSLFLNAELRTPARLAPVEPLGRDYPTDDEEVSP
jgi:hypothetical protein